MKIKLSQKAIDYCHDSEQYNVMKIWAVNDYELIYDRVSAIAKMNPYLAYLCAFACDGEMTNRLLALIAEYIDFRLEGNLTNKRQFSSFLIVKLKMALYDDAFEMMSRFRLRLIDEMTVSEAISGLADSSHALVVFYMGLQKCKRELCGEFIDMMENNDLFFEKNRENEKYFDTSVGYTVQARDFSSLRLYFGNKHVLKELFGLHAHYKGWAQLPTLCEEYFFEMALQDRTKAELFLMCEYISDILGVSNPLESNLIPDNSKASEDEYLCAEQLFNKYMDEHGYSDVEDSVKNSHSYRAMREIRLFNEAMKTIK